MDQALQGQKPPSLWQEASSDMCAVRRRTRRYVAFLEALLDGLMEYEVEKGGGNHAPAPLPAA